MRFLQPERFYICFRTLQMMNIRKTIIYTFLLFVTFCMVAHPSIVHHHHGENVHSIVENAGQHNHDCTQHAYPNHDCEHETQDAGNCCSFNNCLLGDFFIFTHSYKCTKHGTHNCDEANHIVLQYNVPEINDSAELYCEKPPYILHFYSEFIAQFNGLRAPPIC